MWLSLTKGAKYACKRRADFRALVDEGIIPGYPKGKRILVDSNDIDRWMKETAPAGEAVPRTKRKVSRNEADCKGAGVPAPALALQLGGARMTATVEQVLSEEIERDTPKAQIQAFADWANANPKAIKGMYVKATSLLARGRRVSANYLLQWLRNESPVWTPSYGMAFRIPNHFATIFARYLLEENPDFEEAMTLHPSKYDGLELPAIDWGKGATND